MQTGITAILATTYTCAHSCPLSFGARPPAQLRHRFSFSVPRQNKPIIEATFERPIVNVVQELIPALAEADWVALNALGAEDHRSSMNHLDGKVRVPQRFAIDWMQLDPDGRLFHGDAKSNANFYGYGAALLPWQTGSFQI